MRYYIATHHAAPALRKSFIRIRGLCDTAPGKRLGKSIWRSGAAFLAYPRRWMKLLEPLANSVSGHGWACDRRQYNKYGKVTQQRQGFVSGSY